MIKTLLLYASVLPFAYLGAHCQMPCGIYHDDMVYDQIDQAVETAYKGISVMNEGRFSTPKERNEFTRWVIEKEKICDDTAHLILVYFLQQKIHPDDPDAIAQITSAHKLLCYLVVIKQNTDLAYVKKFSEEWNRFKLMFHREGYECEMEKKEFKALDDLRKAQEAKSNSTKNSQDAKKLDTK